MGGLDVGDQARDRQRRDHRRAHAEQRGEDHAQQQVQASEQGDQEPERQGEGYAPAEGEPAQRATDQAEVDDGERRHQQSRRHERQVATQEGGDGDDSIGDPALSPPPRLHRVEHPGPRRAPGAQRVTAVRTVGLPQDVERRDPLGARAAATAEQQGSAMREGGVVRADLLPSYAPAPPAIAGAGGDSVVVAEHGHEPVG